MRRDVWGEPVERGDALGPDLLSPIYSTAVSSDPVRREVARLRVPISPPQRQLRLNGKRVDLTPEQYDELVQLSGPPAKKYLEQEIGSPDWHGMSDDDRVEVVKETMEDFRAAARDALKERHPELAGAVDAPPPLPTGFQLVDSLKKAPRKAAAK